MTTNTVDVFVCTPRRGARLSVLACARDFKAAKTCPRSLSSGGGHTMDWIRLQHCHECTTGYEHTKGKLPERWPDGEVIERRRIGPHDGPDRPEPPPAIVPAPVLKGDKGRLSISRLLTRPTDAEVAQLDEQLATATEPPAAAPAAETKNEGRNEAMAMPKRTITAKGRTQTLDQWAKELGVSASGIRQRIKKGMSEAEAVTTPAEGASPPPKVARAKRATTTREVPSAGPGVSVSTGASSGAAFAIELLTAAGVAFEHKVAPNGVTLIFIAPA